MARSGFYNENEYRDYPFLSRTSPLAGNWVTSESSVSLTELPQALIVDVGVILGANTDYDDQIDSVYLAAIERRGDTVYFHFGTTNDVAGATPLVFQRQRTAAEFTVEHAEAGGAGSSSSSGSAGCPQIPVWEGYLVTGDLAAVDDMLPADGLVTFPAKLWVVEPARVQNLSRSYLRTINLANYPRTVATPPAECSSLSAQEPIIVVATCLTGDIHFKEGYNCTIQQEDETALIIGASPGAGAGPVCGEVSYYGDGSDLSPDGGSLLTGGPTCREVIKTINGVPGPRVQILAGAGFRVYADPDNEHTLVVQLKLDDFTTCPVTTT